MSFLDVVPQASSVGCTTISWSLSSAPSHLTANAMAQHKSDDPVTPGGEELSDGDVGKGRVGGIVSRHFHAAGSFHNP